MLLNIRCVFVAEARRWHWTVPVSSMVCIDPSRQTPRNLSAPLSACMRYADAGARACHRSPCFWVVFVLFKTPGLIDLPVYPGIRSVLHRPPILVFAWAPAY